jgi:hypothetical protein
MVEIIFNKSNNNKYIMNETTVSKMKQIKLYGMHNAFKTAIES